MTPTSCQTALLRQLLGCSTPSASMLHPQTSEAATSALSATVLPILLPAEVNAR